MAIPGKFEKALLKESPAAGGGPSLGDVAGALAGAAAGVGGIGGLLPDLPWEGRNLSFKFNPDKLVLSKSASFHEQPRPTSQQAADKTPPPPQYVGSSNRTLSFGIFLDEWDKPIGGRDVTEMVSTLQKLMDPATDKPSDHAPLPPRMSFHWGSFVFTGYITKADATFTLFRSDGSAARADVSIVMTEHIDTPGAQNPTSGGPAGRRARQMVEGDNLQLLSYREYGKAGYWRALAEINGIDDPLSVRAGTSVLIPSLADARELR